MIYSIALGIKEGELGDLFNNNYNHLIDKETVRGIHEKIRGDNSIALGSSSDAKKFFKGLITQDIRNEFEVYGGWEELCVSSFIEYLTRNNQIVKVPKGFTVKHPENVEEETGMANPNLVKCVLAYAKEEEYEVIHQENKEFHLFRKKAI